MGIHYGSYADPHNILPLWGSVSRPSDPIRIGFDGMINPHPHNIHAPGQPIMQDRRECLRVRVGGIGKLRRSRPQSETCDRPLLP
jgi:hypothetical protein